MPLYVIIPDRDPLLDSLLYLSTQPLIPLCRVALLDSFWGDPGPLFDHERISVHTFFHNFESVCRTSLQRWGKYGDLNSLKFFHVVRVVEMIKEERTRAEIEGYLLNGRVVGGSGNRGSFDGRGERARRSLQAQGGKNGGRWEEGLRGDARQLAGEVIDLCVRIFLMVPIWSFWAGDSETTLTWVDGTVTGAFARHFRPRSMGSLQVIPGKEGVEKKVVFEKGWELRRIEELGVRVRWTGNLLDHLRVEQRENGECEVWVFHHAAFLHYSTESNPDIYPEGLLEETTRTLALLFPQSEETEEWYIQHQIRDHLDGEAIRCKPLTKDERNIESFVFWKDRLITLKQAYDKAKAAKQDGQPKSFLRRYLSRSRSGLQLKN